MTVFDRIIGLLNEKRIDYQILKHEPARTCAEAALIRGTSPDQGAKALVVIADKKPIMIVLPCSQKLDSKKFKQVFGTKDLRFATPEEVTQITGLEIGSIPPFGSLFNIPTYMHSLLGKNERIAFNAGSTSCSVIMNYSDYKHLENPLQY